MANDNGHGGAVKASAVLDSLNVLMGAFLTADALRNRQRVGAGPFPQQPPGGATGAAPVAAVGAVASLLEHLKNARREKGGTFEDEAIMWETWYGDPEQKNVKLEKTELDKLSKLEEEMSHDQLIFYRLILLKLEPEFTEVKTDAVKENENEGKEKIIRPATSEKKRTGYNPRISVQKGIAARINDDLSNIKDVLAELERKGLSIKEHPLLLMSEKGLENLSDKIKKTFEVNNLNEITSEKVMGKIRDMSGPPPDPTQPRPNDTWFMKGMRYAIPLPGSFPNHALPESLKKARKIVIIIALVAIGVWIVWSGLGMIWDSAQNAAIEKILTQPVSEESIQIPKDQPNTERSKK
jgi:hypothetical protein